MDAEALWLPAVYLNYIKGSDFLDLPQKGDKTDKPAHDYATRREAAETYVKDMLSGRGNRAQRQNRKLE